MPRIPLSYAWLSLTALAYWAGARITGVVAIALLIMLVALQTGAPSWMPLTLGAVLLVFLARHREALSREVNAAENRFATLSDDAPLGIWMTDAHGAIRFGNAVMMAENGWRVLPTRFTMHHEDAPLLETAFRTHVPIRCDVRVWRGTWHRCALAAVPRFTRGVYVGHIGTLVDIEARAAAEVEVQRLTQERADLIATMSHEIRTPLTTIIGNAALLEEGLPAPVPPEDHESLAHIRSAADELLLVIDTLARTRDLHDAHIAVLRRRA